MRTQRKLLATLLSLVVLFSLIPAQAFAADGVTTEDALREAVANGGTITLGGDIDLTQTLEIPAETIVVLDLNGYTLTQTGKDEEYPDDPANGINNYGTLTISGGSFNGGIDNEAEESAAVIIESGTYANGYFGNCTFTGGSFNGCTVFGVISGGTFEGCDVRGTIHSGTFQNITAFSATVAEGAEVSISLNNVTLGGKIAGGSFSGTIKGVGKSLKLTGGTYTSELKAAIEKLNYQFATGYGFVENLDGTYSVQNVGKNTFRVETAESEKGILTSIKYPNGSSISAGGNTATMRDVFVTTGGTVTFSATAQAKDNYTFKGWYTNKNGTGTPAFTAAELTNETYTVREDTVLYAVFMASEAYNEMVSKANSWINGYDSQNEFTVASTDDMWCFAYAVNNLKKDFAGKTVKLTKALDFSGQEYIPVGTNTAPFKGTFDGGNNTISKINCSAEYCGVFGFMSGNAIVKNLTVQNGTFSDGYFCGAIAGEGAGTIQNCTVSGCTVSGQFIGGAVGHTDESLTMTNVKVEKTTVDSWWKSGGLVGYNGAPLTTEGCEVSNVTNSGDGLFGQAVGHVNADVTLNGTKASSESEEKSPLIATAYSEEKTITLSGEGTEVDVSAIIPVTAPADIVIEAGQYSTTEPMTVSGGTSLTLGGDADISTSGDSIAELDEGAQVVKNGGPTATAADGGSVDQYGNLILPAGSTVQLAEDEDPEELQKDTVITSNGNIVQGTDKVAPTVGEDGVVTVPAGGSVTKLDGTVIDMTNGGTVTPNETTDTILENKVPTGGENIPSGSHGSSSSSVTTYPVTVDSSKHGTVTVSHKNAGKGAAVTITVKPDDGYELDGLTVTDKNGKSIKLTEGKNGKFTFAMPAGKVTVAAAFVKTEETPEHTFTDVPDGYWAEDEIAWAYENGYMNGNTAATFDPNGTVTRQQLWMILARLSGYQPADFAEAKAWAVDNGVSDGTNPGTAVSRQQLVTILYRYAVRMGHKTSGTADLTAYPDHGSVAAYAADAMGWSVANGVVDGTAQGTLNLAGTATRAQFAAILYRFCDKVVG